MTRTRWLKISLAVVVFFATVEHPGLAFSEKPSKPAPCATPEYRQFDFWLGDWDAFDFDNPTTKVARTRVDLILDGCVLLENYEGADGHKGQSFSVYDSSRKVWHQSWVTNRGEVLVIEGKFEAGEMVLSGIDHAKAGQAVGSRRVEADDRRRSRNRRDLNRWRDDLAAVVRSRVPSS